MCAAAMVTANVKEVSCRALDLVLRGLPSKGLGPEALSKGVPYPVEYLCNRKNRIEWSTFVRIMDNALEVWTEEELVELGAAFTKSPVIRAINLVGRLLFPRFSPARFYRWIGTPRKGAGNLMFACIRPAFEQLDETHVRITLSLPNGYEPCPGFYYGVKGTFIGLPELFGLPPSRVDLAMVASAAEFDIRFQLAPRWRDRLVSLLRLLWPWERRSSVARLKESYEEILSEHAANYEALEQQARQLREQSSMLGTAQRINEIVDVELDVDKTLEAVTRALVDIGEFAGASIVLTHDLDGARIDRQATAGAVPVGWKDALHVSPISVRGSRLGTLRLWSPPESAGAGLLAHVLPSIGNAVRDALAFDEVTDHNALLETRVAERTTELSAALEEVREQQRSREQFLANINHEIRTPVTLAGLALAELKKAQEEHLSDYGKTLIRDIHDSNQRLLYLMDNLLRLAAAQRDELKFQLSPATCDIGAKIRQSMVLWKTLGARADVAVVYDGPDHYLGHVDERAFETILLNLLSNSLKYTPEGGRICVSLHGGDAELELCVTDTGVGMHEGDTRRAFERLRQGHVEPLRLVGSRRGMGIGLSLVKELAESHRGACAIDSAPGRGTTVRVSLPRGRVGARGSVVLTAAATDGVEASTAEVIGLNLSREDLDHPRNSQIRTGVIEASGVHEATVLIAEDDTRLAHYMAGQLADNYRILLAPDGERALVMAERYAPDVLVTDLSMPRMGGLELARRFRQLPGAVQSPVLVVSAFGDPRNQEESFRAGAIEFLAKPFEAFELVSRVRALLAFRNLGLRYHQQEKLAALGRMAGRLAHDLRNPANVLINGLHPLRRYVPPESLEPGSAASELFDVMLIAARQLEHLCGATLHLMRSNRIKCAPTCCQELIDAAIKLVPQLRELSVRREMSFTGEVHCAGPLIREVLMNLLDNAACAAGPGGWVEVRTNQRGDDLLIDVVDSGPGVPPDLRERIFEPLFTTKPVGQGTGLGLPNARRIAMDHGGALDVVASGGPSTFRLTLPKRAAATEVSIFEEAQRAPQVPC